jgi:hypothetical protein
VGSTSSWQGKRHTPLNGAAGQENVNVGGFANIVVHVRVLFLPIAITEGTEGSVITLTLPLAIQPAAKRKRRDGDGLR